MHARLLAGLLATLTAAGAGLAAEGPLTVIRGGTVYDGTGTPGRVTDVAIRGDRIELVGDASALKADTLVDASGLAVAPGFINMLSWSTESLLVDGKSQGEVRQGVTTQIMGEGWSMGPLTDAMKKRMKEDQADLKFDVLWTTLAEYLAHLEKRGVAQNVASYVGAATIREHVIGLSDRPPTPAELDRMRALVEQEMQAGALGIGSSLIYAPGFYAKTEELIELCKVAARYQGRYISHLRSEGDRFLEALDELIRISREAGLPAEVYHLKAAGESNWPKMDQAIAKIEAARKEGLAVTADMYTYVAGATGFDACVPRWSLEGGRARLPRAPQGRRDARAHPEGVEHARDGLREPVPGHRLARAHPAGRVQDGRAQAADRTHARGRGEDAREGPLRRDAGSHERGPDAHRGRVLPDVGGQRPQADPAAVGLVRLGRVVAWRRWTRSPGPPPIRAPTGTSRACSASTCATRS